MKWLPILLLLTGCKTVTVREPVEVQVPYPVRCTYSKVEPARCYFPCEVQKNTPVDVKAWAIVETLKAKDGEIKELRKALETCGDAN